MFRPREGFFSSSPAIVELLYGYMAMSKKYLTLEDISAYTRAYAISNRVWDIVMRLDYFAKRTIGQQFVRAVDSISANIAEGFGRYSKKDKIKFYRYSFGSLKETQDWCNKANDRKLLTATAYESIKEDLETLPREINSLIKYTNQKLAI